MSTTNDNKRQQLISKLREMFQMDQADLDFGIYRSSPICGTFSGVKLLWSE